MCQFHVNTAKMMYSVPTGFIMKKKHVGPRSNTSFNGHPGAGCAGTKIEYALSICYDSTLPSACLQSGMQRTVSVRGARFFGLCICSVQADIKNLHVQVSESKFAARAKKR